MILNFKNLIVVGLIVLAMPIFAAALEMPADSETLNPGISAQSYIVVNETNGEILAKKNSEQLWVPASLTKLITALVFLDTKPNLNKIIVMQKSDQTLGGCSQGGACLPTKAGVSYRLRDLFYASLISSYNNATVAVARSTGLSSAEFADKMNQKAAELGALSSHFVEPTGMSPENVITAQDYSKIALAAFDNSLIQTIGGKAKYSFSSTNNKRYYHTLKNTDKLLGDDRLTVLGAKTGFLNESKHNFSALFVDQMGNNILVVLLGSANSTSQFRDARELAALGTLSLAFNNFKSTVLGTSTLASTISSLR